jgi:hypothetical protein
VDQRREWPTLLLGGNPVTVPQALNLQTVIAVVWDFDKTLSPGYMQDPLFEEYQIDAQRFWSEVNGLVEYYRVRGLRVSKDTAYLGHLLSYVRDGRLPGLSNPKLRELGRHVVLAPGMPDFMARAKERITRSARFAHHGVTVEHYIVSTGLRQMIEGNPIIEQVDDVWASELLSDPPGPDYLSKDEPHADLDGPLTQVGYVLDNTTKTRAIFEINKGANKEPGIDVNARMADDDRRVPISNMIYVADGPSDVPVFSLVNKFGGRTLGVYTRGEKSNYSGVKKLQDDGRVNGIAEMDYTPDSAADLWLMSSLSDIATGICDRRDRSIQGISGPAGHVV